MNFDQFKSNPLMYIAFLGLGVIGYLYFDAKRTLITQVEREIVEKKACGEEVQRLNRELLSVTKDCTN